MRKFTNVVLTGFASLNEAAFSFVGMLALLQGYRMPQHLRLTFGLTSALAAFSIESEVFHENVASGLDYAFTAEGLKLKIIRDIVLNKYNENLDNPNSFLTTYAEFYIALSHRLAEHTHNEQATKEIDMLQRELMQMDYALMYYFEKQCLPREYTAEFRQVITDTFATSIENFATTYARKSAATQLSIFFNLLSLPGCFFASTYMAYNLFVIASLTGAALTGGVLLIALLACVSNYFIMHNTFCEMIYNDQLQEQYTQLKNLWNRVDDDGKPLASSWVKTLLTRLCISLTMAAFTALIILVTLATAGTWAQSSVAGAAILFNYLQQLAVITIQASALLYTAITVVFNIKNIMEVVSFVFNIEWKSFLSARIKCVTKELQAPYKKFFGKESLATEYVIAYPLAIIAYTLQIVTKLLSGCWFITTLMIHSVSEGVTADNGYGISKEIAASANGLAECFTDVPYLVDCSNGKKLELGSKINPHTQITPHQHTGILDKLFFITLSPILLTNFFLTVILTKTTVKIAYEKNIKNFWSKPHKHHHPHHKMPKASQVWKNQIAMLTL